MIHIEIVDNLFLHCHIENDVLFKVDQWCDLNLSVVCTVGDYLSFLDSAKWSSNKKLVLMWLCVLFGGALDV